MIASKPKPTLPWQPMTGCTPMDVLQFSVDGTDDQTQRPNLRAQLLIAESEAALATVKPVQTWALRDSNGTPTSFVLTGLIDRSAMTKFCFAVQLADEASNVGPPSSPVCVNTADRADPLVVLPKDEQGGCSTTAAVPMLLGLLAVLRARR